MWDCSLVAECAPYITCAHWLFGLTPYCTILPCPVVQCASNVSVLKGESLSWQSVRYYNIFFSYTDGCSCHQVESPRALDSSQQPYGIQHALKTQNSSSSSSVEYFGWVHVFARQGSAIEPLVILVWLLPKTLRHVVRLGHASLTRTLPPL